MVVEDPASPVNSDNNAEEAAVLIGQRRGHVWEGRLCRLQMGDSTSVEFDWAWVLEREEQYGDVIGFYHTHPSGRTTPSQRDVRTMRAWVSCFGKPLLCAIESGTTLTAYVFETNEDKGRPLAEVQRQAQTIVAFDVEREFPTEDSGQ